MMKSQRRMLAGGVAVLFLLAGCGLKQGATDSLGVDSNVAGAGGGAGTGAGAGPGGAGGTGAGGTSTGPGGSTAGGGGASGTLAGGGGANGNGSTAIGGNGSNNKPGACGVPSGGTTTGITSSTINVGLHAPLTGPGTPFPHNSFRPRSDSLLAP